MANATHLRPGQEKEISGPEIVGRIVALETAFATIGKMLIADRSVPDFSADAFRAQLLDQAGATARGIGHPEAEQHARDAVDRLLNALKP